MYICICMYIYENNDMFDVVVCRLRIFNCRLATFWVKTVSNAWATYRRFHEDEQAQRFCLGMCSFV